MSSLGFPVTTEKDFRHFVFAASEFGRKIESPNGSYTLWEPGNGIELWVQTNLHKRIIGMNLHFSGHSRMHLGLTRRISKPGHSIMEGGVREPPLAQSIFSGHVLVTQILINPVTDQRFYWARVRTLGGEVDVVADPQVVQGRVIRYGIIKGSFWLSGRLV